MPQRIDVSWSQVPPHKRTLLIGPTGWRPRPILRHVEFPQWTVFTEFRRLDSGTPPYLHVYAADGPVSPGSELLLHPLSTAIDGPWPPHIYESGSVCFGYDATMLLHTRDPRDVFWQSHFNKVPAWLSQEEPKGRRYAPVSRRLISPGLSFFALDHLERSRRDEIDVRLVSAPWLTS